MMDFTQQSVAVNIAIFGAAATFVWAAGTRLSEYAGAISAHTGIGKALLGLLLLGGIAVTALLLIGLAERRNRTLLRVNVDLVTVLLVYLGELDLLYALRP
jgi:hypothetical protein